MLAALLVLACRPAFERRTSHAISPKRPAPRGCVLAAFRAKADFACKVRSTTCRYAAAAPAVGARHTWHADLPLPVHVGRLEYRGHVVPRAAGKQSTLAKMIVYGISVSGHSNLASIGVDVHTMDQHVCAQRNQPAPRSGAFLYAICFAQLT